MQPDPKNVVRRLVEGLIQGRLPEDALDLAFVDHQLAVGLPNGPDGLVAWADKLRAAFPDLRLEVAEVISEGDRVCVRGELVGTHRGELDGQPASGMYVRVPWLDLWRVRNGRAVERWGGPDLGVLLQQIGALPMPEPA